MPKPTEKDYQAALKSAKLSADLIRITRERIDNLIDQIIESRENILYYESAYNDAKEIIERYKAYEEIEKGD